MTNHSIHRIRLQGPWEVIPPGGQSTDEPEPVTIPATWRELFGDVPGTAIFRRQFNSPTGLQSGDKLLIRLPEDAGRIVGVSLNGVILMARKTDPLTFDVTEHLHDFNRLEVSLGCDPKSTPKNRGGLWQAVLLEIHVTDP